MKIIRNVQFTTPHESSSANSTNDGNDSTSTDSSSHTDEEEDVLQQHHPHPAPDNPTTPQQLLSSEQYEQTIEHLTFAMTELHRELRDKTSQCEALHDTATALSNALQESDELLQEKALECEHLQLKLQMVTFVENRQDDYDHYDDDPLYCETTNSAPEETGNSDYFFAANTTVVPSARPAAVLDTIDLPPKKNSSSSKRPTKEEGHKANQESHKSNKEMKSSNKNKEVAAAAKTTHHPGTEKSTKKNKSSSSASAAVDRVEKMAANSPYQQPGPVCVDDEMEDESSGTDKELRTTDGSVTGGGIRPEHFYNVIMERDRALRTAKKLGRDLKHAKHKVRDLQSKVECSKALVEISYDEPGSSSKNKKDNNTKRNKLFSKKDETTTPSSANNKQKDSTSSSSSSSSSSTNRRSAWRPGLSLRQSSQRRMTPSATAEETCVFITEDEMLHSKWNKSDAAAKAALQELEYLEAINDANQRAAGAGGGGGVTTGGSPRSKTMFTA